MVRCLQMVPAVLFELSSWAFGAVASRRDDAQEASATHDR